MKILTKISFEQIVFFFHLIAAREKIGKFGRWLIYTCGSYIPTLI